MPVRVNPSEMAEKWKRRLTQATPDIQRGVERVTESPMEKAAAASDKMLRNVTEAVTSGKYARGLARVSLPEWKDAVIDLGIPRIAQGVARAETKFEDFARQLLPHIESGMSQLDRMPDVTLEDSVARMTFWLRHMATFERS